MDNAFLVSAALIFVAELGDKSQLMALAFATKYKFWPTVTGIFFATLLVHAGSVLIGRVAAAALPVGPINVVAGLAWSTTRIETLRNADQGVCRRLLCRVRTTANRRRNRTSLVDTYGKGSP
jgi:putative Ca2+/H+ antiporter (TMEM165/GDT1 family)